MDAISVAELTKRFVHNYKGVVTDSENKDRTDAYLKISGAVRFCEFNHEFPVQLAITINVAELNEQHVEALLTKLANDGCPYLHRVSLEKGVVFLLCDLILIDDFDADMSIFDNWLMIVDGEVAYLDHTISKVVVTEERGGRLEIQFSSDTGRA